jgi:CDP-4-dehydro-6-deoxyglucose reductase
MTCTVTISTSGERFLVNEGETILQAAQRQGITLPYGCDSGICGVCIIRVVEGRIEYPGGDPMALFDEDVQAGKGLCCVGHPCGDLVIELLTEEGDWEPWE